MNTSPEICSCFAGPATPEKASKTNAKLKPAEWANSHATPTVASDQCWTVDLSQAHQTGQLGANGTRKSRACERRKNNHLFKMP